MFIRKRHYQFALMFLLVAVLTFSLSLSAQDDITVISSSSADVLIKGPVQEININIVTIANLDVILDVGDPLLDDLVVGDVISVEGNIFQVGVENTVIIIPIVVTRLDVEIIVPIITLQGAVENINGTIITVYGIDIQLAAGDPLLNTIQIGDVVIVNGNLFVTGQTVVIIVVTIIIDVDNPQITPEATAEMTPEATPEVTPEVTEEPDDDDNDAETPVIVVIEGPVTSININIITIYNIEIEVSVDDPILAVIQVGDVIRVEGEVVDNGTTIIIIAITIVYIDIDVIVNPDDGEVWRGDNCQNPPPPWAPANGWRRKCEGGGNNNRGNGNNGNGRGRGNGRN